MARSRPATIICQRCGLPGANSIRGAQRKYHPKCAVINRRQAEQRRRDDPEVQRKAEERKAAHRKEVEANPELQEEERSQWRARRQRQTVRAQLWQEHEQEMAKNRLAMMEAIHTLNTAADRINTRMRDLEHRVAQLEGSGRKEEEVESMEEVEKELGGIKELSIGGVRIF